MIITICSCLSKSVSLIFYIHRLPLVIEMYGKEGELDEVKDTVLEILQWFDPEDPYWKVSRLKCM